MKYLFVIIASLFALPAAALTVSNLDEVEHYVVFEETQGSKQIRVVAPGESIRTLVTGGVVYLKAKPEHRLFIEEMDRLAIWPDAKLQLQMRRNRRAGRG